MSGGVWLPLVTKFLEGAGGTGGNPITHGRELFDSNTGLNYNLVDPNSLTPLSGPQTYSTPGETIEGKLFDDTVNLNADGITLRNCMMVGGALNKFGLVIRGSNCVVEGVNIHQASGVSWYIAMITTDEADGTLIKRCDVQGGDNNFTNYGTNTLVQESYIHDTDNTSDPSDHPDNCEVYGGSIEFDRCKLPMGPVKADATINIAPWVAGSNIKSVSHVDVHDCVLDGGQAHIIAVGDQGQVRNVKVRRNDCGGHTNPDTNNSFGIYMLMSYWTAAGLCETQAEQDASGGVKILCPSSGADANYWRGCDDLTPNLSGQVAYPRT